MPREPREWYFLFWLPPYFYTRLNKENKANEKTAPEFRIRGISSINAGKAPLIVLDGARGANGVIIVTTKKGDKARTSIIKRVLNSRLKTMNRLAL